MSGIVEQLAASAAFRPALSLEEHAATHIPFRDLGFDADPEAMLRDGIAQHQGLTVLVGEPGHGKSSVLARMAEELSLEATPDGKRYLPLFVPVASRAGEAAALHTFGAIAIGHLLATFEELSSGERDAFREATAEEVTREGPSTTFNAKLSAKAFGTGIEGGAESKREVVTVTTSGETLDEFGGLATLAHTLRGRDRELVVIVEDTDGWALKDGNQGRSIAQRFFGGVLAPLARSSFSVVVALQTHWTTDDIEEFAPLNERVLKRVTLPAYDDQRHAERALRHVIAQRMEWKLGSPHDMADAVTDPAISTLAQRLRESGSMREALTRLRDALDRLGTGYPERIDTDHLVDAA